MDRQTDGQTLGIYFDFVAGALGADQDVGAPSSRRDRVRLGVIVGAWSWHSATCPLKERRSR